jgi:hypothetical protein
MGNITYRLRSLHDDSQRRADGGDRFLFTSRGRVRIIADCKVLHKSGTYRDRPDSYFQAPQ